MCFRFLSCFGLHCCSLEAVELHAAPGQLCCLLMPSAAALACGAPALHAQASKGKSCARNCCFTDAGEAESPCCGSEPLLIAYPSSCCACCSPCCSASLGAGQVSFCSQHRDAAAHQPAALGVAAPLPSPTFVLFCQPDLASLPVTDTSRNHSKAALCPVVHEGSSSVCWGAGPSRNWQINLLLRKTEGHRNLRRPSVFSNVKALKLKLGDF